MKKACLNIVEKQWDVSKPVKIISKDSITLIYTYTYTREANKRALKMTNAPESATRYSIKQFKLCFSEHISGSRRVWTLHDAEKFLELVSSIPMVVQQLFYRDMFLAGRGCSARDGQHRDRGRCGATRGDSLYGII